MVQQKEYIRRRKEFLAKMEPISAALIFAAPQIKRSLDNEYPYHQNSDFKYFTGFNESQALLLLIKNSYNHCQCILFNQSKNKNLEQWSGRRLGQKLALSILNVDLAFSWDDINNQLHLLLSNLNVIYHARGVYFFADQLLFNALDKLRNSKCIQNVPNILIDWRPLVHNMRLFKSQEELKMIRQACKISSLAHIRAMQRCQPDMYEYQLEGEIHHEFSYHGARFASYNTIISSGKNSHILHYTENNCKMKNGDLVLIDAGCEYQGYASDITRTFPINGKFSPEQQKIYNIVLKMLNCALELAKPGQSIQYINTQVINIMVTNLVQLGIMNGNIEKLIDKQAYKYFFMHSICHWLGLDVHDTNYYCASDYSKKLEPGMVLAIEPAIYISSDDTDIAYNYRGINIRIEDNIFISSIRNENLTATTPKEIHEIEAVMSKDKI